jgi:hypothetical protein
MADLVKEFFRRDLSDSEVLQLERLLDSSDEACLRMARFAEKAYLRTGLPHPKAPGGAGGGPTPGNWLGPLQGFHPLMLATVLTGVTAATVYWHFHSAPQPAPIPETVQTAPIPKPVKAPLSVQHSSPKPAPAVAMAPQPTAPPSVLPNQGLVEPMAYVPGKQYGGLSVIVDQTADDLVTVRVLDSTHAEVRTLYAGLLAKGTWTFTWDGKLSDGKKAGVGSYWVEVESGGKPLSKEIKIQGKPSHPGP